MTIAKWLITLLLASVLTLVAMMFLGLTAALFGNIMSIATFGESIVGRYQALFAMTATAGGVASIAKLVVLFRKRAEHNLRAIEYIEHIASSGFLAAGLTYGALALIIATMRDITEESISKEIFQSVVLYVSVPIVVTFIAVLITVTGHVEKIPNSRELSASEKYLVQRYRLLRKWVSFVIELVKEKIDSVVTSRG